MGEFINIFSFFPDDEILLLLLLPLLNESKNAELLTMTYGSLVTQLLRDYEDPEEVNIQLEKM